MYPFIVEVGAVSVENQVHFASTRLLRKANCVRGEVAGCNLIIHMGVSRMQFESEGSGAKNENVREK